MKQTKRLIPFLLAVLMCVCALVPVTANAETTEPEVLYYEDFATWTQVPANTADAKNLWKSHQGMQANDNYAPGNNGGITTVENGVLSLLASGKGAFDIQLYNSDQWTTPLSYKKLTSDFTLSLEIKPLGPTWNRSNGDFLTFRYAKGTSGADATALGNFQYIFTKSGMIGVKADGGDAVSEVLSTTSFNRVEIMFDFDETTNLFKTVTLYVNGANVGTATIAKELPAIDQFRMFQTYTSGQGMAVDSATIVKGNVSLYEEAAPEKTTFAGYQTTAAADGKFDLRLVGVMADTDVSAYTKVGFNVQVQIGDKTLTKVQDITTVYEKIVATETATGYKEYTAAELGGAYIFALNCKNIPTDQGAITFTVTTYYQLGEDATVAGETVTFTVDPANDIPQTEV